MLGKRGGGVIQMGVSVVMQLATLYMEPDCGMYSVGSKRS